MGRSRYKVSLNNQAYFVTCSIVNWLPLFSNPEFAQTILDSLDFLNKAGRLILHAFVIMENHLHLIVSSPDLQKELGDFKSFTARKILDSLKERKSNSILEQLRFNKKTHKRGQTFQLWQEGSHPQLIVGWEMLRQKMDYLHANPVRRGYVEDPAHWRYSSYRNYLGEKGILEVELIE
jgi:REP element-mobilizing transposase RayT